MGHNFQAKCSAFRSELLLEGAFFLTLALLRGREYLDMV